MKISSNNYILKHQNIKMTPSKQVAKAKEEAMEK